MGISDARLVYNMHIANYADVTMKQFSHDDANSGVKIDILDTTAIISAFSSNYPCSAPGNGGGITNWNAILFRK